MKLANGGTFKFRSLDVPNGQIDSLDLKPLHTGHFFNVSECKDLGTYFIPRDPWDTCIDAYAPSVGYFQMTTNPHHGINDKHMKKILKSFTESRLYFVVPENIFSHFPRQQWINSNDEILSDYGAPSKKRRKNVYGKLKQFVILFPTNL
jgi:hypothetical protein